MEQHTATGGTMAAHYGGNEIFDRLEPNDLVVGLVAEHDRGWVPVDKAAPRDPHTDLPWSVYKAPTDITVQTGPSSIDYNESRHPYRGLLASMHIVGLFNGRYGMGDTRRLDALEGERRRLVDAMVQSELARQTRLRSELAADGDTSAWVQDATLMRNYLALQFFDRIALWLQLNHPDERKAITIDHVPTSGDADVDIEVTPLNERHIQLTPYPFDVDRLDIGMEGRWLAAQPPDVDLAECLAASELASQPVTFVSAP